MNFTCNTKPLSDALSLGVINANVSNFYKKSTIAQVSAIKNVLKINLEADSICSEILINGRGDEDACAPVFVSSVLLKQLVSTFDTSTVTFEFQENGLVIHSGRSKFSLPKMLDESEMELRSPMSNVSANMGSTYSEVNKDNWKFIKDNQMYAIAMAFAQPVYTKVWMGDSGDVLVGDLTNGVFTHSKKGDLHTTCLLQDTIINLFNSLPDGAQLVEDGSDYILNVKTDGFSYVSRFTPQYENDDIGYYSAEDVFGSLRHSDDCVTVNIAAVNKFLSQASLLSTSTEDKINFGVTGSTLRIHDNNVNCSVDVKGSAKFDYTVPFKTELLRLVLSHFSSDEITFAPYILDGELNGVVFWNDDMTTVLAGVDE